VVSGLQFTDTAAGVLTGGLTRAPGEHVAGSPYAITQGTLAADSDYTIAFTGNSLSITPATLTVTADAQTKTYGDADPALTYKITTGNLVGSDSLSGALSRDLGENVGTYAIKQGSLSAGSNYTLTYVVASLQINPRDITVTADAQTKTYGDADPALTYKITTGNLVGSDSLSGGLTRVAGENVGTYAIGLGSLSAGNNYSVSLASPTVNFAITPEAVTITPTSGQSKTYGNSDPTLTYSYSVLGNGDTASVFIGALSRAKGENVGSYAIGLGGLSAGSNYTLSLAMPTVNFAITPKAVTVTADPKTKTYGDVNPTLTGTLSGVVNGDNITASYSTTASQFSDVVAGGYAITATLNDPDNRLSNYAVTNIPGTLTISKADQTITWSAPAAITYGTALTGTQLNATVAGVAGGSNPGALSYSPASGTVLDAGDYTLTVTAGATQNYNQAQAQVPLHVNQASLTAGVVVLDPTANGALTVSGNGNFNVAEGIVVDSSSPKALTASGNAQVTATSIQVVGEVSQNGNALLQPNPTTGATPVPDPLAALAAPSTFGLTDHGSESFSANSQATIGPGIYSQISVSGNAVLNLEPGTYIIEGGGLSVSGGASLSGSGVFIYNAGSKYPGSGGHFGAISISGGGTVNLAAPTTGVYAGVLIFQARDNSSDLSFSGNALAGMSGTIYAADAQPSLSGNAKLSSPIIVDTLSLSGNGNGNVGASQAASVSTQSTAAPAVAPSPVGKTTPMFPAPVTRPIDTQHTRRVSPVRLRSHSSPTRRVGAQEIKGRQLTPGGPLATVRGASGL
jgi:hypothetical protein